MLPNNTYYKDGALINSNSSNKNLKNRVSKLEKEMELLKEELKNVREYIKSTSSKTTTKT
jgi:chaperonin cofactor prefoldin